MPNSLIDELLHNARAMDPARRVGCLGTACGAGTALRAKVFSLAGVRGLAPLKARVCTKPRMLRRKIVGVIQWMH